MPDHVLAAGTAHINASPTFFRQVASDFLDCYRQVSPQSFSLVPFFLVCRALELALKAEHLEASSQEAIKDKYWHDLEALYNDLPAGRQILNDAERTVLQRTNAIYKTKAFEYMQPGDAGTAFSRFPDHALIAAIAQKLMRLPDGTAPNQALEPTADRR
jgi:hypothetical protein